MTISRDTHAPEKNYRAVSFHEDRTLLDSELNEAQEITQDWLQRVADALFREGAILTGLQVTRDGHILTLTSGKVYLQGGVESVPGAVLTFAPEKTTGADYVWVELLRLNVTYNDDSVLVNPYTGEPSAEREKWQVALQPRDTTADALPTGTIERHVIPILKFERDTGDVLPTVKQKCNLSLSDFGGTLPGERITVGSVTEHQLSFAASEGLTSILANMAERTFDQSGNYLVRGLSSFVADTDAEGALVTTNAGRAYVLGRRFESSMPISTHIPLSADTRTVQGEQKTFTSGTRRYVLNSQPLQATSQVEAIVEITTNVTRGPVAGGEDSLYPNPVVQILSVSQGGTTYEQGIDWQQSGNQVDWLAQNEPVSGTTYSVTYTYTRQMVKGDDYVDGSWFGEVGYTAPAEWHYCVTVVTDLGESQYLEANVVSRDTLAGEINRLSWSSVPGALSYRVYRGTDAIRTSLQLLANPTVNAFDDDGVDTTVETNPPSSNSSGTTMSPLSIQAGNNSCINFGPDGQGVKPVSGSNCSIDYAYYLARRDILAATTTTIIRLIGIPSEVPKDPVVPDDAFPLCSIYCPPNSTNMAVRNFGSTRVTMAQIHKALQDLEDLKYNDARSQMNTTLLNRTADAKKGVYSDDFSNSVQSDPHHEDWNARFNTRDRWVAPGRSVQNFVLSPNQAGSNATFFRDVAMLPSSEVVLISQPDWSESRNVNPWSAFDPPPASLKATPNIGRRDQTTITVYGENFTKNATNVTVRCAGQVVLQNQTTNSAGQLETAFLLQSDASLGRRIVSATDGVKTADTVIEIEEGFVPGRINQDQSQTTSAPTFRIDAWEFVYHWHNPPIPGFDVYCSRLDPLAQTFSFAENKLLSSVGVFFTAKDSVKPVIIQIRGVTSGVPNGIVYAEKYLQPSEVLLDAETKATFANPVYCEANAAYAVVVLTDSDDYFVRTATLGAVGQNGVITRQAYAAGVLLESSNAETWTPMQGSDLTMKLYGLQFQATGTIQYTATSPALFHEIHLDEFSVLPGGCSIAWELSRDGGTVWTAFTPGEDEAIHVIEAPLLIRARFASTRTNESPALLFKTTNLIGFVNDQDGLYITRELETTQNISSTVLYVEQQIPSSTTVTWYASNDGGATWEEMSITATRAISQDWTEYTYEAEFTDPGNRMRYKAIFACANASIYPRVHKLGATLS